MTQIKITKITDVNLARQACEKTFLGTSKVSLDKLYRSEHSPVRTQLFWIEFEDIELAIGTHFLRHHVGSVPFMLTKRDDRGNDDKQRLVEHVLASFKEVLSKSDVSDSELKNKALEISKYASENGGRETRVKLGLLINAQSLIDMAEVRLCYKAHYKAVEVMKAIKEEMQIVDKDLAKYLVPKCISCFGKCNEFESCGFLDTKAFVKELHDYAKNFRISKFIEIKNTDNQ